MAYGKPHRGSFANSEEKNVRAALVLLRPPPEPRRRPPPSVSSLLDLLFLVYITSS